MRRTDEERIYPPTCSEQTCSPRPRRNFACFSNPLEIRNAYTYGLEIIFFSNRPGTLGGADLWASTRQTVFDSWSVPENLGPVVNSTSNDAPSYLSSDGRTLFFTSDRPGGFGGLDLYVTTRTKAHEK
jgi:hypothetical protein